MSVTPDDVREVASLARLRIPDERLPALVQELNGILAHMDELQQVDLRSLVDDPREQLEPQLRVDRVAPISMHTTPEQFAPLMRDGFFLVPRLHTHTESGEGTP